MNRAAVHIVRERRLLNSHPTVTHHEVPMARPSGHWLAYLRFDVRGDTRTPSGRNCPRTL